MNSSIPNRGALGSIAHAQECDEAELVWRKGSGSLHYSKGQKTSCGCGSRGGAKLSKVISKTA